MSTLIRTAAFQRFAAAAAVTTIIGCSLRCNAQDASWETVLRALEFQNDSITSIDSYMLMEVHTNDQIKQRYAIRSQEALKESVRPADLTPERVYSYHWLSDQKRWRCDRTQFYPSKPVAYHHARDFMVNTGEKIYRYDGDMEIGYVSDADENKSHQDRYFLGSIGDNIFLPYKIVTDIKAFSAASKFQPLDKQVVNGERCLVFASEVAGDTVASRCTVWVTPDKGFSIVKFMEETVSLNKDKSASGYGNMKVYSIEGIKQTLGGTYFPSSVKRELYDITGGTMHLQGTDLVTFGATQLNEGLADGDFAVKFPPGTSVADSTGQTPAVVGLNPRQAVQNLKQNKMPTQELAEGGQSPAISTPVRR